MTLREARCLFTSMLPRLIDKAQELGFECAIDEATERLTQKDPTSDHMKGSLHHLGLAVDLLLYKEGEYCTSTDDYLDLGEFWEGLATGCNWGGRFNDGNHFSFSTPEITGNRK